MKNIRNGLVIAGVLLCNCLLFGQNDRQMTIQEIVKLTMLNHKQLKLSEKNVAVATQQKQIAKLQKLPNLNFTTNQFYLGNAMILDKDFSNSKGITMPHYGSNYSLQANQLIFKGGLVNKSIEMTNLREQLSELDLQKDQQNVKFLVIANYLDIYRLLNQKDVYVHNKNLAQERLKNVEKFYQQGMITRNEVIRGELAIKNLDQAILVLENNKTILNFQMNLALGLDPETVIIPQKESAEQEDIGLQSYMDMAKTLSPVLKAAEKNIEISKKNIEIIQTDKMPTIAAFGGYSMQRPITTSIPALDMYSNSWQTGLSLSYNLDNLYKTKEKEKLGTIQKNIAEDALSLTEENVEVSIHSAYTKYKESILQVKILEDAMRLADENYKITEAKYLNQLAVQAEMIDAQNQKLQAELDYNNGKINILYQYYKLLKETGSL